MTNTAKLFDLDLPLFDFATAFQEDRAAAARMFQLLLLDRTACRRRVALLRALEERAKLERPELVPQRRPVEFLREIDLIIDPGTIRGLDRGLLSVERLVALSRDPDALWETYESLRRLITEPDLRQRETVIDGDATAADTKIDSALVPAGFTDLVAHDRWGEFSRRLRPWLPALLRTRRLDASLADELLVFLLDHMPEHRGESFRAVLPGLLDEFAERHGGSAELRLDEDEELKSLLRAAAMENVLHEVHEEDADWMRDFRIAAIERRITSSSELLGLATAERFARHATKLPDICGELIRQAHSHFADGCALFGLSLRN